MNKVILSGRLTRDPEIRYSQAENSMAIARFTLAVDNPYKKDGESSCDFISCVAFGKTAEFLEKYCHQGIKLIVEGRWQTGSYTNKDGVKVYTNDCAVTQCEFAESKSNQQNTNAARHEPAPNGDGFMNIPDGVNEGLPFA